MKKQRTTVNWRGVNRGALSCFGLCPYPFIAEIRSMNALMKSLLALEGADTK